MKKTILFVLSAFIYLTANAQSPQTVTCNATGFGAGQLSQTGPSAYSKTDPGAGNITVSFTTANMNIGGYAVFNLSAIPAGATVTGVSAVIFVGLTSGNTNGTTTISGIAADLSTVAAGATLHSDIFSGTSLSTTAWETGTGVMAATSKTIALNAAAVTLVQNNISGTISLGYFKPAVTGTGVYTIAAEGSAHPPQLIVTYTLSGTCSGTPTPGTVSPLNAALICSSAQTFTLSGTTIGNGITYQWEQSTDGGATFSPVSGATTSTYAGTFTAPSTMVNCIVTCSGSSAASDTATVTVSNSTPAPGTVSPLNAALTCSTAQTFTLSGATAGTGITYQWEKNTGSGFAPVSGATNTTWAGPAGTFTAASTSVFCLVTCTLSGLSAPSDTAVVTVNSGAPAVATVSPATASTTLCSPTQAFTLTGSTAGTSITYQWQINTGAGFTNVSGATAATFTGSFYSPSTVVDCIVSCAVSGQPVAPTTSTTATVNNTSTPTYLAITSAAPYFQGFENTWITKCGTGAAGSKDDVPDANWINTPVTGNASWRRDDDGASAAWTETNTDMAASTGSHFARFNTWAVTITPPTGKLDLYLDLSAPGTKQLSYDYIKTSSPFGAGLGVYLSTTGPAGTFTRIDTAGISVNWSTRTVNVTSTSPTCVLRFIGDGDLNADIGMDNLSVAVLSACSGAPAAFAISPTSFISATSSCSGAGTPSQTFTLSGYLGITGLTYQWEQSTNGGATYTPISSATSTSYTGLFLADTTLVNCLVTCTASGITTPSATATYIIEPQPYFPISTGTPYTQGFENTWITKCATGAASSSDDAPDVYWVNAATVGDSSWRRDDDGASAAWTNSVTDIAASTGNHWARFDIFTPSGERGSLDLYLDLSAADSTKISYDYIKKTGTTKGLGVYFSTNGPSGPFTLVDTVTTATAWSTRTFHTTSTSPTCVLRFRATSDFGSNDIGLDNIVITALAAAASPTLTTSISSLTGFNADACGLSALQSFTVSGSTLNGSSVTVTAPAGFEVSQSGFGYGSSTTILYSGSTLSASTVDVKFDPIVAGPISGYIIVSGGGATTPDSVAVSGIGNGLRIDSSMLNFGNITEGIPSLSKVDTLRGYNLAFPDNITVSSSNGDFQLSADGNTWGATCQIQISGSSLDAPVYVRLDPSALGAETPATISFAYGGTACTPTFTATGAGAAACVAPGQPSNMTYPVVSATGVTVSITPNGTPTGYLILESVAPFVGSTTNGTTYAVNAVIGNGTVVANTTSTTIPVSGLTGNTTYYFTVIPYNGGPLGTCGSGPVYETQTPPLLSTPVTTCIATPATPTANGLTAGGFTINWIAPPSGGAFSVNYTLDVSTNNTFTLPITGSPFTTSATTLAVTGLNSGTTYFYRVTAVTANGNCTPVPSGFGTQATSTCATATWLGTTNSDWSNGLNWSCGAVPASTTAVTIPAIATTMPSINSGTFNAASISLAPTTTLAIAGGATLNITGALTDSGVISGAGVVALNGTAAQTYKGNGAVSNLTLNNSSGASIATTPSLSTLNITGTLLVTFGTFTGNGGIVLVSNASGTGRIGAITGTLTAGTVKVQQYIPGGRRAFRFLGHPFNTAIPLSQLETNMDITGTGGNANGFTNTNSNNPSAFWFNTVNGDNVLQGGGTNAGWTAFTNTNGSGNNAWNSKEGIRILVRGFPGEGLDGNAYTPSAVTLNMNGTINTGAVTEPMALGPVSSYNLLSNPYPSPTDIGTVITNAGAAISGSGFWVWNAEMQTQGAYTTVPISAGYYLPANASFTVKAATATNLSFAESNKGATTNDALFKVTNMNNGIALHLYDTTMRTWDMLYVSFNGNAADSMENYDASHLHNPDLDFYSLSANDQKLSIDARPYTTGQVVPLGITTNVQQKYTLKAENFSLPSNEEVYLHDKYLNQYQQLQDGSQYTFSITSDPASQGNNRFELSMAGTAATGINNVGGSNGLKVSMVPNPATEQVTITYEAPKSEKTSVRIMNMAGQSVVNMELGDEQQGSVVIPLHNVAAGMYMVELINGSQIVTQRLVKQ